ncbi:MAG: LamG-like jellyroll fold domain-containing protein [Cyanobacteria bacterium P01_F01_bin.116]
MKQPASVEEWIRILEPLINNQTNELWGSLAPILDPAVDSASSSNSDSAYLLGLRFHVLTLVAEVIFRIDTIGGLRDISPRILAKLNPIPVGTGFLVGGNQLLTNYHVVSSPEIAAQCVAQFNYVQDASGYTQNSIDYLLSPQDLFISNPALDYTLVQLKSDLLARPAGYELGWIQMIEDPESLLPGWFEIPYSNDSNLKETTNKIKAHLYEVAKQEILAKEKQIHNINSDSSTSFFESEDLIEYDLELIVENTKAPPSEGKNSVIISNTSNSFHVRLFNETGYRILDALQLVTSSNEEFLERIDANLMDWPLSERLIDNKEKSYLIRKIEVGLALHKELESFQNAYTVETKRLASDANNALLLVRHPELSPQQIADQLFDEDSSVKDIKEIIKQIAGDPVYIIQHPKGRQQQIVIRDNRVLHDAIYTDFIRYRADSDYGSSGSPVFNDRWQLVALHHAAIAAPKATTIIETEKELSDRQNDHYLGEVVAQQGVRICSIIADLKKKSITISKLRSFLDDYVVTAEQLNYPPLPRSLEFDGIKDYVAVDNQVGLVFAGTTQDGQGLVQLISRGGLELSSIKLDLVINESNKRLERVWLSPDSQMIVTAINNNNIQILDRDGESLNVVETLKVFENLDNQDNNIVSVSISTDKKLIACAISNRTVMLWNRPDRLLKNLGTFGTFHCPVIDFSPKRDILAIGSDDGVVKLLASDGQVLHTLSKQSSGVMSIGFSPDGNDIVIGCQDDTLHVWSLWNQTTNLEAESPFKQVILGSIGHTQRINSLSFSPDNTIIATASNDRTIKLWDLDGNLLRTCFGHSSGASSVAFSPDSQTLVSGSYDNTIKLWDRQGNCLQTLKDHSSGVTSVSFSPDGQILASGSYDDTTRLWTLDGKCFKTLQAKSLVKCVRFSPDQQPTDQIIVSGDHLSVSLWNREGNHLQTIVTGKHTKDIAFSPDGQTFAIGMQYSDDYAVKLYEKTTDEESAQWQEVRELRGLRYWPDSVEFSPDGETILISFPWGAIQFFDRKTGELKYPFEDNNISGNFAKFSPDGKTVAASIFLSEIASNANWAYPKYSLKLWKLEGERPLRTFPKAELPISKPSGVSKVAFSPNGQILMSLHANSMSLTWHRNIDQGNPFWQLQQLSQIRGSHRRDVTSVSFSSDGATIVSSSSDAIKLWNHKGRLLRTIENEKGDIACAKFNSYAKPNKSAILSLDNQGLVKFHNPNGDFLESISLELKSQIQYNPFDISQSPDGRFIIFVELSQLLLFDRYQNRPPFSFEDIETPGKACFSADSQYLAYASSGIYALSGNSVISIMDLSSYPPTRFVNEVHKDVRSICFSPIQQSSRQTIIAGGGADGTITLWTTLSGVCKSFKTLSSHSCTVTSLSFSPDGRLLASADADGQIILWDLRHHEESHTIQAHSQTVTGLSFSPDGQLFASASADGTVKLWNPQGEKLYTLGYVEDLAFDFSSDGNALALLSNAATFRIRNAYEPNSFFIISKLSLLHESSRYLTGSLRFISQHNDLQYQTDSYSFAGAQSFCLEAWINPDTDSLGGTIISRWVEGIYGEYILRLSANREVIISRLFDIGNVFELKSYLSLPSGQFTHVAAAFDGGFMRLYFNGEPALRPQIIDQIDVVSRPFTFLTIGEDKQLFMVKTVHLEDNKTTFYLEGNSSFIAEDGLPHIVKKVVQQNDQTTVWLDEMIFFPPIKYPNPAVPVLIGACFRNPDNVEVSEAVVTDFFKGSITEVRIWDAARKPEEIKQNFFRRLRGNEPNLVGYWRFEEGTDHVHNLAHQGDVSRPSSGRVFNGSWSNATQYPPLPVPFSLMFTQADSRIQCNCEEDISLTIQNCCGLAAEAWVKHLFGDGPIIYQVDSYALLWHQQKIRVELYEDAAPEKPKIFETQANAPSDRSWHHIAFSWGRHLNAEESHSAKQTFDDTDNELEIYIDGKRYNIVAFEGESKSLMAGGLYKIVGLFRGPLADSKKPLFIGGTYGDSKTFMTAAIAEVRLWKCARTQNEIKANLYRRLDANLEKDNGLIGYWRLDEELKDTFSPEQANLFTSQSQDQSQHPQPTAKAYNQINPNNPGLVCGSPSWFPASDTNGNGAKPVTSLNDQQSSAESSISQTPATPELPTPEPPISAEPDTESHPISDFVTSLVDRDINLFNQSVEQLETQETTLEQFSEVFTQAFQRDLYTLSPDPFQDNHQTNPISRLQAFALLTKGLGLNETDPAVLTIYPDRHLISEVDWSYKDELAAATQHQLVVSSQPNPELRPNEALTQAELAVLIYQGLVSQSKVAPLASDYVLQADDFPAYFSDIAGHWAEPFLQAMGDLRLIDGFTNGTLKPDQSIIWEEYAELLVNVFTSPTQESEAVYEWGQALIKATYGEPTDGDFPADFDYHAEVTRLQVITSLLKAIAVPSEVLSDPADVQTILDAYTDTFVLTDWAKRNAAIAIQHHLIVTRPDLPKQGLFLTVPVTHAEAIAMVYQALVYLERATPISSDAIVRL